MKMTQPLKPSYWTDIERQIKAILHEIIFVPVLAVVNKATAQMKNQKKDFWNAAEDVVRSALRTGRIQYADGTFSGEFSAAISKSLRAIGAKFDSRTNTYRMDHMSVPPTIKAEAASYNQLARSVHDEIKKVLGYVDDTMDDLIERAEIHPEKGLFAIERDFQSIAQKIQVKPQLDDAARARLYADYNKNLKLYIAKFSRDEVVQLRKAVEKNANEGYRFDRLISKIKINYSVTQNKAKFLARQETGLYMSKFREQRFVEAGFPEYIWRTSHDSRVRDDHKRLDGKKFRYDQPPVVNQDTQKRANPGEDFQCRCIADPVTSNRYVEAMA